ncbi:pyrroline-5-carboxylate reductase [Sediminitomix flava]|uniref:Pyrroline-5-carboxylate reductase n=1 Tax=Sediminitomix flava TaxID=379075 RepID=A0A315ZBX6_SEDFL|nr:pyrroline-5-carboxylate reductase [Sediminitomix flava]PWJ42583.1 pyrroline-5-carboxylate reductase [Sediminitomix flava]
MEISNIAIIGGGNLGKSIANGLLNSEFLSAENLYVTRRKLEKLNDLKERGVNTTNDNVFAAQQANLIILAIKPFQIKDVLTELNTVLDPKKHVLVSVVTGASLEDMQSVVGKEIGLFRAMPNTAIAISESMTCISTNNTSPEEQATVVDLFSQLGKAVIIDDSLMAAATVLGACGIAYAMRFIRAASQGGIEIGFGAEISQLIASQTVKGAASLLLESGLHPEQEIDKVTTPQGCTIAGLNEMEHQGFSSSLIKGVKTSFNKISDIEEDV